MTITLDGVVVAALIVVASVFGACATYVIGHGLWLRAYRRRSIPQLAQARTALSVLLLGPPAHGGGLDRETLRLLPEAMRARLFRETARSVDGESLIRLRRLASNLGLVRSAHVRLESHLWWRRLDAARTLQALDPEGRRFIPLMDDPHPAVRAQAAEWAAEDPNPEVAEALLQILGRSDSLSRFVAQDSLLRLGSAAVGPIVRHLSERPGRDVLPALQVAVALAQPPFAVPATRLCGSDVAEVRTLAAELLGMIGGSIGAQALTALLTDAEVSVRAAAVRALGRIGHWPAAVAVAELLRDPQWEVRQAAGLALRELGDPGELMLRRYRGDSDRFAADMARRILELPVGVDVAACLR